MVVAGPYNETRKDLPICLWSIEVGDPPIQGYFTACSQAPESIINNHYFSSDSLSGSSLEMIAIAGIAKMF